ncbi:hypothetical protein MMC10_000240 [Thelotrema lepadinum]|nr:hypothetical protein [Thelotrema lepadinum]
MDGLLNEPLFVLAMKQSEVDYRIQWYYLIYADNPRRWRRVIVSAYFGKTLEASQVSTPDEKEGACKTLPKAIQCLLQILLPKVDFFDSVTSISMCLEDHKNGVISPSLPTIGVTEDTSEVTRSDEARILQDIEDLGCPQFLESEVITEARITSSRFDVLVENRRCIERKAPFTTAGMQGANGFNDFVDDLKLYNSIRGCSRVAEFVGVVLDDTRTHLRSYLYETPLVPKLETLIAVANTTSTVVPWAIRESWAFQIAMAISEVHNRGLLIGYFGLGAIGVRADGRVILHDLTNTRRPLRHFRDRKGDTPPELRKVSTSSGRAMSFRTDVFQLGLALWLLAENKPKTMGPMFCAKAACTRRPRYSCTANHCNPVQLPPCSGDIPSYFNSIIQSCRSPDPKARPSARKLVDDFQRTQILDHVPNFSQFLSNFDSIDCGFDVYCDECGMLAMDAHYHCSVCRSGDFDICPTCFADGIHCFISEHRLMKRVKRNGSFVDVS